MNGPPTYRLCPTPPFRTSSWREGVSGVRGCGVSDMAVNHNASNACSRHCPQGIAKRLGHRSRRRRVTAVSGGRSGCCAEACDP